MNTHFILTADLQSGKTQYGNVERQRDIEHIFRYLCQLATHEKAGLIIAGDFYDEPQLVAERLHNALDEARQARQQGSWIAAIDGNHDGSRRSWFAFPESPIESMDGKIIEVNGCRIGFLDYRDRPQLEAKLQEWLLLPNRPHVIIGHQMFDNLAPMKGLGQFGADTLAKLGWTDVTFFLGDLHTACDWHDPAQRIEVVYPGSPEMTAQNEGKHKSKRKGDWEDTTQYAIRWTPSPQWPQQWEHIALPARPWRHTNINTFRANWEDGLKAFLEEIRAVPTKDSHQRKPVVSLVIHCNTQEALKQTYWDTFCKAAHSASLTFLPVVVQHRESMEINGGLEPVHLEQIADQPELNTDDATAQALQLLAEQTADHPDQPLVIELAQTALKPNKAEIKELVRTKLNLDGAEPDRH